MGGQRGRMVSEMQGRRDEGGRREEEKRAGEGRREGGREKVLMWYRMDVLVTGS